MSKWTVERVLSCLSHVIHSENYPWLTLEELTRFRYPRYFDEPRMKEFLEYIHQRSQGKMAIYGSPQDLQLILEDLDVIPEFDRYTEDGFRMADSLMRSKVIMRLTDMYNEVFISKHDWCLAVYNFYVGTLLFLQHDMHYKFIYGYMRLFADVTFLKLDSSFELIHQSFVPTLSGENHLLPNEEEAKQIHIPSPITEQDFYNLRYYMKEPYIHCVDDFMAFCRGFFINEDMSKHQEYFTDEYTKIRVFLLRMDAHAESLQPFKTPIDNPRPFVRIFVNEYEKFVLSGELDNALQCIMAKKNRLEEYRSDFCTIETAEDRRKGIVNAVNFDKYEFILSMLKLQTKDIHELHSLLAMDYRQCAYPIFSHLATHAKPARDAFLDVFYYLTAVMKIFQGVKQDNMPKVLEWIDNLADVFSCRKNRYLVEYGKIQEMINRARHELKVFNTEKTEDVPNKLTRQKKVLLDNVKKLMGKTKYNFKHLETIFTRSEHRITNQLFTYQFTYFLYNQMMLIDVLKKLPKIRAFFVNQTSMALAAQQQPSSSQVIVTIMADEPALEIVVPSISTTTTTTSSQSKKSKKKERKRKEAEAEAEKEKPQPQPEQGSSKTEHCEDLFNATSVQIAAASLYVLAHLPEDQFVEIKMLYDILGGYYSQYFYMRTWNYLGEMIKDNEQLAKLFTTYLFLFFDYKIENGVFLFRKKEKYSTNRYEQEVMENVVKAEQERITNLIWLSNLAKKEAEMTGRRVVDLADLLKITSIQPKSK